MRAVSAYTKKEFIEAARGGRMTVLLVLFLVIGIMNPAIAKLTPAMMEMLSDTMEQAGIVVTDFTVDAMDSWTQFYKNMPIAMITFVLLYSDIFTREYKSGTLLLMLTKGLSRYKVVIAKAALMLSLWTAGYWLCFAVTYGYNAFLWDNGVASNLFFAAAMLWLFGVWTICLIILFSSLLDGNTGVALCTGGVVLASYLLSIIPRAGEFSPMLLVESGSLLTGGADAATYIKAAAVTAVLSAASVFVSIPIMNKRQM